MKDRTSHRKNGDLHHQFLYLILELISFSFISRNSKFSVTNRLLSSSPSIVMQKKSKRISWWLTGLNVFLSAQFWVAHCQSFSHTNIFDTFFQHTIRDTTINCTIYFYFSCFCCSSPFVSLYNTLFRYSNGMLGAIKLTSDKMYGVRVFACTRFLFSCFVNWFENSEQPVN